jgi:hypothetical protein
MELKPDTATHDDVEFKFCTLAKVVTSPIVFRESLESSELPFIMAFQHFPSSNQHLLGMLIQS